MTEFMQGYLSLTHLRVLSIQGLLQDSLQKDLCPCYFEGVLQIDRSGVTGIMFSALCK